MFVVFVTENADRKLSTNCVDDSDHADATTRVGSDQSSLRRYVVFGAYWIPVSVHEYETPSPEQTWKSLFTDVSTAIPTKPAVDDPDATAGNVSIVDVGIANQNRTLLTVLLDITIASTVGPYTIAVELNGPVMPDDAPATDVKMTPVRAPVSIIAELPM
jgi:hypothetical protein